MKYYTIQDNSLLIAESEQALTRYYNNVFELPADYEQGKYIIGEKQEYEEVIDYDEDDNPIGSHTEIITTKILVLNPNYEQEQAEKEAQRVAMLHLTRGDVFRALLLAKGVTRTQLRAVIEALPEETNEQSVTKEMALIDFDEALDFYRGNALIDTVGAQLGITQAQMTRFFDTNDWHELINEEE